MLIRKPCGLQVTLKDIIVRQCRNIIVKSQQRQRLTVSNFHSDCLMNCEILAMYDNTGTNANVT